MYYSKIHGRSRPIKMYFIFSFYVLQKYPEFLLYKTYFFNLLRLLSYSMSKVLTLK